MCGHQAGSEGGDLGDSGGLFVTLWATQSMGRSGQSAGAGGRSPLQGIFPTQVSGIAGGFFTS